MEKLKDKYDPNSVIQIKQQVLEQANESSQLPASNMGTPNMPSTATLAADSETDDKDLKPEEDKDIKLEDDMDIKPEDITLLVPPPQTEATMELVTGEPVESEPPTVEETGMDVSQETAVKAEASNLQTEQVEETQDVEMK
jgi:hypothetical protein